MRNAQIIGTGSYVPERLVTNAELEQTLGEPWTTGSCRTWASASGT